MQLLTGIEVLAPSVEPLTASQLAKPDVGSLDFNKVFKESLAEVNGLHTQAQGMVEALATGKTNDVSGTMIAVQKSNLAFLSLLQIRNKLVEAYQEIMRMRM